MTTSRPPGLAHLPSRPAPTSAAHHWVRAAASWTNPRRMLGFKRRTLRRGGWQAWTSGGPAHNLAGVRFISGAAGYPGRSRERTSSLEHKSRIMHQTPCSVSIRAFLVQMSGALEWHDLRLCAGLHVRPGRDGDRRLDQGRTGEAVREVARSYNVSQSTISQLEESPRTNV
jgi:hypothetical protein